MDLNFQGLPTYYPQQGYYSGAQTYRGPEDEYQLQIKRYQNSLAERSKLAKELEELRSARGHGDTSDRRRRKPHPPNRKKTGGRKREYVRGMKQELDSLAEKLQTMMREKEAERERQRAEARERERIAARGPDKDIVKIDKLFDILESQRTAIERLQDKVITTEESYHLDTNNNPEETKRPSLSKENQLLISKIQELEAKQDQFNMIIGGSTPATEAGNNISRSEYNYSSPGKSSRIRSHRSKGSKKGSVRGSKPMSRNQRHSGSGFGGGDFNELKFPKIEKFVR
eukprot:CAMPEP_0114997650 /NCGR_PEP_ID=MMETSP0216-20121206/15024_1 /TAXON_ID=223996 /ORGANISM="Protocruzia adherens, Strain Boccale" /LENGTH=284 /DNA_ID=CAMNT_0002362069 /DNA_START=35 /DNA_END=889 /DNA_ORIENTATION=+